LIWLRQSTQTSARRKAESTGWSVPGQDVEPGARIDHHRVVNYDESTKTLD